MATKANRRVLETKYVFYCDKCTTWYDTNEMMSDCPSCGRALHELDKDERAEFYWKIARTGYKVVSLEEQ